MACVKQFSITVDEAAPYLITNASPLPGQMTFIAADIQLLTSGGTAPHTFAIIAGSLGPGASMTSAGLITVNTTTASTRTFTVQATDSSAVPKVTSKGFSLTVTNNQPVWSQLLWGAPAYILFGSGSASFTPASTTGASFSDITNGPTGNNDGKASNSAHIETVIPWTGSSRLHLEVTAVDINTLGRIHVVINVTANGTQVAFYEAVSGSHTISQDFDFSLNGKTTVDVSVSCESNNSGFGQQGPVSASASGTFSNL